MSTDPELYCKNPKEHSETPVSQVSLRRSSRPRVAMATTGLISQLVLSAVAASSSESKTTAQNYADSRSYQYQPLPSEPSYGVMSERNRRRLAKKAERKRK